MDQELLKLSDVEQTLKIKKSKIYNLINEGSFPRPVAVGKRGVRWKKSDIEKWIANLTSRSKVAA